MFKYLEIQGGAYAPPLNTPLTLCPYLGPRVSILHSIIIDAHRSDQILPGEFYHVNVVGSNEKVERT